MASNQPASASARPLSMMTAKLSPSVYLYEPPKKADNSASRSSSSSSSEADRSRVAPKLVLVASWMDARDPHIAKYITHYQVAYPTAAILLVKYPARAAFLPPVANRAAQQAVWYLRSRIEAGTLSTAPARPEILVHLFSNGGAATMHKIYQAFRQGSTATTTTMTTTTGDGAAAFPLHAAVYDSTPGLFEVGTTYNAFIVGFRPGIWRLVAGPVLALMVAVFWVLHRPLRFLFGDDLLARNARAHNDPGLVRQTNRAYVYGDADSMVGWRHVEMHAEQAAAAGFEVRREMFDRSPHVAHMRLDNERYWKIVRETWEKALGGS